MIPFLIDVPSVVGSANYIAGIPRATSTCSGLGARPLGSNDVSLVPRLARSREGESVLVWDETTNGICIVYDLGSAYMFVCTAFNHCPMVAVDR